VLILILYLFTYLLKRNTTMKKLTKLAAAALTGVALLIGTTVNAQTTTTTPSKLRFGIGLEAGAANRQAYIARLADQALS
jgi:hypothetical protein